LRHKDYLEKVDLYNRQAFFVPLFDANALMQQAIGNKSEKSLLSF
jgi:hypothetical protein